MHQILKPLGRSLIVGLHAFIVAAGAQGLSIPVPVKPFGELPNPPPPDYSQPASWAALPDRADAADVVPENDPFGDRQASAAVDVFYIHPTTYRETAYWNQPIDDANTNAWTTRRSFRVRPQSSTPAAASMRLAIARHPRRASMHLPR